MIKKVLLITAMFMATSVWAEWTSFGKGEFNDFFVDYETLESNKGSTYMWIMYNSEEIKYGVRSVSAYHEYKCEIPYRTRILSMRYHELLMAQGRVVETLQGPSEWDYPVPNSAGEALMKKACTLANSE